MSLSSIQLDAPTVRVAATPRRTRPQPQRGALRLTARGRVVLLTVVMLAVWLAFAVVGGPADSTSTTHHPAAESIVVAPGQTLWDIARTVAPDEDTRSVVAEIAELNHLADGGAVRAGQPLTIPTF